MSADRTRPDEPKRLRDGVTGDPALDELGRWFASVPPAEPLGRAGLSRVAQRLDGAHRSRRGTWRGAALAFACVALAGGAAATWGVLRAPEHRSVSPTVAPVVTASARPSPAARRRAITREPEVAPAPEPSAAPSASPRSLERPPSARAASPEPPPSAASELSRESQALERALTALRREHDPARALALLERYAADFPAGMLRLEADVARVDAHLALGQRAAALAILDRLPLERVGRGLELRVVRAELYAERDCARATRDFDHVLAASPPASLDERALYGRASCRTRLGDSEGARTDLERYLTRYPNGRFAARARELTR
jgi:TolA-binding protein